MRSRRLDLALFLPALLFSACAYCGQTVQPGFYSHEPHTVDIRLGNASSGLVCDAGDGQPAVCDKAIKVVVTGEQTCTGTDGKHYPCTRYGYQFDYSGANSGEVIQCTSRRRDAFRSQEMEYQLELGSVEGKIFYPAWVPYSAVERRTMLTEVHECAYRGELLTTIEFIIYYEPDTPAPKTATTGSPADSEEHYFDEIPNACGYLVPATPRRLMQSNQQQEGQANEHIPNLWSQCTYSSIDPTQREVGYVFKFMLHELFDVEKLNPMQLNFHATFVAGGQAPEQTLHDLGKIAFVYLTGDRTALMVITGIMGPPDGARRPRQVVASYHLKDPGRTHDQRLAVLRAEAEKHLSQWYAGK